MYTNYKMMYQYYVAHQTVYKYQSLGILLEMCTYVKTEPWIVRYLLSTVKLMDHYWNGVAWHSG